MRRFTGASLTCFLALTALVGCGSLPTNPAAPPALPATVSPAAVVTPTVTPLPTLTPTPTSTPTPTPGPGLDELLQTPVALYTVAELDGAATAYAALAELYPNRAEPWLGQAAVAQRRDDDDAALAYLQRAVEAQPSNFEAWRQLAVMYEQRAQYADAAEAYGKLIDLAPDDPNLYVARAMAEARLDQADAAIADLRAAQTLDPYREYAWLNVAGAAYGGRSYDTAIAVASAGLEAYPGSASLRIQSGLARLAKGEAGAALADFEAAAAADPNSFTALRWKGEALAALGRDEEAIGVLQQAGALGTSAGAGGLSTGFEAMTRAAQIMARSDPQAAFEYLADQVIRFGQPPPLLFGYALVELERGNPGAALNRLTNLIDLYGYLPAYYWRARIYADEGSTSLAIADLQAFLAVRRAGPDAEAAWALLEELGG